MKVPLIDLQLQYASIREEILSALTRVCDAQQLIMGPEVDRLALPIHPELGREQQAYVVDAIKERLA